MDRRHSDSEPVTPRLFAHDIPEVLSRVHPSVPHILYVPLVIYVLYVAVVSKSLHFSVLIGFFGLGLLCWTLLEYIMHRYAFHYEPRSERGQRISFLLHGIHHAYPTDPKRLVMPPVVSLPLAVVCYGLFFVLLGPRYVLPFFAGIVCGYLCYDTIHYAVHHYSLRTNKLGLWLKHYHYRHHYQDKRYGFGVSSPLWDLVFRTMPPALPRRS
jgi:sterol desaturase/sphingolipid hydroxylase (fatty acid hydroxylase superfamily)